MKLFWAFLMFVLASVSGWADDLADARGVYEAVRIACADIPAELSRVSGGATAGVVVGATGTVVAGGALVAGIAKQDIDAEIGRLVDKMCAAGGCESGRIEQMSPDQFAQSVIVPMAEIAKKVKELTEKSKRLGNWRTGLMGGTIATNVAAAVLAGVNRDQSDLIQKIQACNTAVSMLVPYKNRLIASGVNPLQEPLVNKIDAVATWCAPINIQDVEKIEKRMGVVMGAGIAGAAIGVVGTATSAAANSDKVRDDDSQAGIKKEKNLNVVSNIFAGANVATGAVESGLGISLVQLSKKLIKQAELCVEAF